MEAYPEKMETNPEEMESVAEPGPGGCGRDD
jgi:hypothetical protein